MKAVLNQRMRVPQIQPPRVGEQRMAYVQGLIVESMGLITAQDIVNAPRSQNEWPPFSISMSYTRIYSYC